LSNKARFILMVVEGELEIRRKKKADLLTEFKKLKFTPVSELDAIKGNTALEEADMAETQEKDTDKTEYDYLLNVNLWSLTYEEVEEIQKQLETKKEELDILKATTNETMWTSGLVHFQGQERCGASGHSDASGLRDGSESLAGAGAGGWQFDWLGTSRDDAAGQRHCPPGGQCPGTL